MAGICRVVFFVESPLTCRDRERFGVEVLRRRGFEVEVWDFTALLHAEILRDQVIVDPAESPGLRKFTSWREARTAAAGLTPNCCVINLISYRLDSYLVYRLLSQQRSPYALQLNNVFPLLPAGAVQRVTRRLRRPTLRGLLQLAFARTPCGWLGVRPAALLLTGGARSLDARPPVASRGEVLSVHAFDYDLFLCERDAPAATDPTQGVFLDEFIPFHSDWQFMGMSVPMEACEYYPLLCRYFDALERQFGVRIVIAAHPRSYYDRLPDLFGGRPVVRGRTSWLIRTSGFAISHCSVSVNFPVLYRRPVIFVTTRKLAASFEGPYIVRMAEALGRQAINLEEEAALGLEWELAVDEGAYAAYQHAYIKEEGSPELPFWEIVANRLERGVET